jgi:eukaryotic-like serine/threonine-protein kinase
MSLSPGARLGSFEVVSAIGAGGMGEVYRARDTKLARDVALKVLPESLASDPERLARLRREAQVLAALNHPNIAAIHGFEDGGNIHALVLELVEGETLADRIARGPIPFDDALPIARQLAEALEAAHQQGIIHRDLKPANIKLRPDGTVKVLDFGLAKLNEPNVPNGSNVRNSLSMSPTLSLQATMAGVVLGTAAYMSPEQARGRVVDKRTDIWAFGCVVFEMLTGRPPFRGEDLTETLAAVVKSEPEWEALPAETPVGVRQMLRLCLEKDPRRRIRDISAAQLVLDGAFDLPTSSTVASAVPSRLRTRRILAIAASAFVVGGAVVAGVMRGFTTTQPASVAQFVIPKPPDDTTLTFTGALPTLAISRDGERVVYRIITASGGPTLYLRDRGALNFSLIQDTAGARSPFFSPDGEWIGFSSIPGTDGRSALKRVSVRGGGAQTICIVDGDLRGATWLDDGTIVFGSNLSTGLRRVPATGGTPQVVTRLDPGSGEVGHYWPHAVPGGRQVLFTVWKGTSERSQIAVASLADGKVSTLASSATFPRFMTSGHLVFASGGELRAVPFSPGSTAVTGTPVAVAQGIGTSNIGAAQYDVSERSLLYIAGVPPASGLNVFALFDRAGTFEPLKLPAGAFQVPRISPDGRRLAYGTDDEREATIWVYDVVGSSAARRLTFEGQGHNRYPVWSADGQYVAFQSDRDKDLGVFQQRADGSGTAERLTTAEAGVTHIPESWSPDGSRLLYNAVSKDGRSALWVLNVANRKVEAFGGVRSPTSVVTGAVFSPDGKWVAYASSDNRQSSAVYVQPFPATGAKYQISRNQDDAHHPVWAPDGTALYFTPGPGGRMNEVKVSTRPTFTFGEATTFPGPFDNTPPNFERPYDITHDGRRFVGLADATDRGRPGKEDEPQIRLVLNWVEELKRLVPVK